MNEIYSAYTFQLKAEDVAFNAMFELFPINFSWMDTNGFILGCNQTVLNSLNLNTFFDIIGKHVKDVTSELVWENNKKVLVAGRSITFEEIQPCKDGSNKYYLSIKSPLKSCQGEIIGLVNIAVDVTQQKLLEMELEKAKEAAIVANNIKTEFLANMRHDLRTPLSGVLSISEFLHSNEQDENKKSLLKDINTCTNSLLRHINEIQEHLKIESGELSISKKEFNIYVLLQDVYQMMLPSAINKHIDFNLTISRNLPHDLLGDYIRLQRILMNIISNSIKFTDKGYIKINVNWFKISDEKGVVEFLIEDSGIGIPHDKKEIIFERFHRLHPSYEGKYSGSGLGLNIVKRFLDEVDGEYELNSELGIGTSFKILIPYRIPLMKQAIKIYDNQSTTTGDLILTSNKKRILLVEDHEIIARISKTILEDLKELNCEVDVAENGKKALDLIEKAHYDLVFLDIGLPDIDGYTVAKSIRSNKNPSIANVKIFALTAHTGDEEIQECLQIGMNEVWIKPLSEELALSLKTKL